MYVAWDNAGTHQDEEVEAVVRGAAGRLVLLYLPTYGPWLNPIEMRRRRRLAALPPGGHPLRAVHEHLRAARGDAGVLRALQPHARAGPLDPRGARQRCTSVAYSARPTWVRF
ncbi:MAG: transposase [Gemmatimonadaceae bacterium]